MKLPSALVSVLREAHSVVALTGAGISAESGIPTFRDALTGLWAKFDPADLATPEAFARDPATVTRWYDERRQKCAGAKPNAGHLALAALQREFLQRGRRFTLITQNVDRLHQAAGSRDVIELHGTLWVWRCTQCGEEREEREPFREYPPRCRCGGTRRPGVVWFGEELPAQAMASAEAAAEDCEVFLSIGTSAVVYPAAGLAHTARRGGAKVAEVNAQPTDLTPLVDWSILALAGQALPELVRRIFDV
ncbi:MAG TPA: NAD-dependent deacylase [Verrucomicrobiae bacterium]|nr:NAD-dependent deacylase [Verrucomicrobiae bacterium]